MEKKIYAPTGSYKRCGRCKQHKDYCEFNKNSYCKDGHQTCCRVCNREMYRERSPALKRESNKRQRSRLYTLALARAGLRGGCTHCSRTEDLVFIKDGNALSVAVMINLKLSKKKIIEAVEQSVIVCRQCKQQYG